MVIAAVILRAVAVALAINATSRSARRLQDAVFERVHDTVLVEAGTLGRPSMLSRCTSYVDQVQEALLKAQTDGVLAFASLLLSLSLVLWIDVPIGMMLIGAVLIFEVIRRIVASRWTSLAHHRLDLKTALSETTDAAVSTVASVRAIRAEDHFRRRFGHEADEVRSWTTRLERFGEAFGLTAFAIGQLGVLIVIGVVGFLRADLSIGEATAAVLYVRTVAEALSSLPAVLIRLHEAAPYMRRLRNVLLAPLRRPEPTDPVPLPARPSALHAENLEYGEPDRSGGCTDVSFTATPSRWVMLVGPVGSGCESIVAVSAGLEVPTAGRVLLDAVDLATASRRDISGHVAVLPARSAVLEATLAENLTVLRPQATADEINAAVAAAGLSALVARYPDGTNTLVGGRLRPIGPQDRARIGLARVLLSHAEVVIISDPTVGLDLEAGEEFWAGARRYLEGRIVIATTPRLDLIDASDQVVVLERGGVVDVGTRAELLARRGVFTRLWQRMLDGVDPSSDLGSIPGLVTLSPEVLAQLATRLVTERFDDGQTIIATGEVADRVFIVVDGSVELFDGDRRVATVKAGNHFGDLEAAGGALTTFSAVARGTTVLRSLHRLAISGGAAGVLDRSPAERALYAYLARNGVSTTAEIEAQGYSTDLASTLDALVADGVVVRTELDGELTYRLAGSQRRRRGGLVSLLDTL
ncbi:MAG: ATP-binding cassette domain-containing protein [Actinomycetota bacterium]